MFHRPALGVGAAAAVLGLACGLASGPAAAEGAPAPGPSAADAVAAFRSICLGGEMTPPAVLSRADAAGWSRNRPDDAGDWDPSRNRALARGGASLMLAVWQVGSAQFCSLGSRAPTTGWVEATTAWLGVKPEVTAPTAAHSSVYYLIRTDAAWRPTASADPAAVAKARADGRYYSVVASDGAEERGEISAATLMVTHPAGG